MKTPSALTVADSATASRGLSRLLLLAAGWLSLALGVLGIVLPLLPTAPFLLLAVACFTRSAPSMAERIYRMPVAGKYLRDWQRDGIDERWRWMALAALWLSAASALLVVAKTLLVKMLVLLMTVLTSAHFLLLPGRRRRR